MKYNWSFILATALLSCNPKAEKSTNTSQQDSTKTVKQIDTSEQIQPVITVAQPSGSSDIVPAKQAIMEFIDYNDDGDYFILNANKNSDQYGFINESEDRSLVRGDLIDITWKETTVEVPGDGSYQKANQIISIQKVKDGKTSKFRKAYQKQLKYTWAPEDNYAKNYLDKIYKIVEYYIANSKNQLIQQHIKNKDQLSYSIEKQTKDNKEYTMIGISTTNDHSQNVIQWLYLDNDHNILYDYDLPNDKLIKFP